MASPRRKALEDYAKNVELGMPQAEDYISKSGDVLNDALRARNLAEESLAQKVLDNTGIPIPDKTSPIGRKEDFLNRILQERYPEIKNPIELKDMKDNAGEYFGGKVSLNKNIMGNRDIVKLTSDVLHEGGHGYDDIKKIITSDRTEDFNKELRRLKAEGFDLKNMDPSEVYEAMAGKHHAQIPKLREGTYGLGALKNYLKSGTFKAIPVVGPAIGAGIAAMSGDANAASALPILGEADSLGPEKGSEDYSIENPQASPELRRKALESLLKK